jgi:hypothetical protein
MHPEAQAKAFEEIDHVIGQDRLPTLEDLDNLPYIEALLKETFRWSPLLPISELTMHHFHARILTRIYLVVMQHLTTEDTVYDGYFIPKGSILLANIKYEKLSPWGPIFNSSLFPKVYASRRACLGISSRI